MDPAEGFKYPIEHFQQKWLRYLIDHFQLNWFLVIMSGVFYSF